MFTLYKVEDPLSNLGLVHFRLDLCRKNPFTYSLITESSILLHPG